MKRTRGSRRPRDRRDDGATAVEYALLLALVSLAIFTTVGALGGTVDATFSSLTTMLTP